jgi:hypothetical protein
MREEDIRSANTNDVIDLFAAFQTYPHKCPHTQSGLPFPAWSAGSLAMDRPQKIIFADMHFNSRAKPRAFLGFSVCRGP